MAQIKILDHITIDKIAAGEVVERPASVCKELIENAIDANATNITVEIKDGGTTLIRVTDSGTGIEKDQVRNAFLRHATSKIENVDDLNTLDTLGFRGEALASIAAVSQMEMITKTESDLTGIHYVMEGGKEIDWEEVGAPTGTTIVVRNLFFNTPARKKFLKKPQTEGIQIQELMNHLALSHPEISFKLIMNNQVKINTPGNGRLKDVIYRLYGKEMDQSVRPFFFRNNELGFQVEGYLGVPHYSRSNRSFEIFFVNGRFIRSHLLSRALEEAYMEYLMLHKFPVCVLNFQFEPNLVDVNVHPTKMEVRISNEIEIVNALTVGIRNYLKTNEILPEVNLQEEIVAEKVVVKKSEIPESFEHNRIEETDKKDKSIEQTQLQSEASRLDSKVSSLLQKYAPRNTISKDVLKEATSYAETNVPKVQKSEQLNLFEEKIVSKNARQTYRIIGQVFDTYWMVEFDRKLLIIDQHAAHEKVKFEALMKEFSMQQIVSQNLIPPIVISLSPQEKAILSEHEEIMMQLGFVLEDFGGNEYTIRAVPLELYGTNPTDLLMEILADLQEFGAKSTPEGIRLRIATMACKAAVKGNNAMSFEEMEELLDQLLLLENPYHCPHGRPTMIVMNQYEMEKKFKRVID